MSEETELEKCSQESRSVKELVSGMRLLAKAECQISGAAIWTNDIENQVFYEKMCEKMDALWDELNAHLFSAKLRNNRPSNPRTS